jgi:hypothetical protein
MAQSGPDLPVSLERERERTVALLGDHFAQDNLSLEELEVRIEQAYRARDLPALRELLKDLPSAEEPTAVAPRRSSPAPEIFGPEEGRIVAVMSQTQRRGVWHVPRSLDVWSVMSDTKLDLTQAVLSPGVTELDIHGIMTAVKIVVPPGVRVVMQAGSFMSDVSDLTDDPPPVGSGAPVVRITGFVLMAELKVSVRRREVLSETPADESLGGE